MLVGHFAVALAGKGVEPRLSVGTLALAAMLADIAWTLCMLAGVEHASFTAGVRGAANYLVVAEISFSHSLLLDAVWGSLFAAVYFVWRRRARGAWLLLALVLSHWVLDTAAHKPDMPLAPGLPGRYGLGL